MLLLFVLFFAVQATTLDIFERDFDEGVYLVQAHLFHVGHELYTEVTTALPPFLIWGLAAIYALVGEPSVVAARVGIFVTGALGLAAIAWCGQELSRGQWGEGVRGRWGDGAIAFFAAFLLFLLPRWLFYGQMAMADIPSLSFSLLAVALALKGWSKGRRYFFLGGVAAGIAMGLKFLAAYTAPLLALIVILSYRYERQKQNNKPLKNSFFAPRFGVIRFVLDGAVTLAGFLLPMVLALPFFDVVASYETIFRFHWEAGREWLAPWDALRLIGIFHWEHLGWSVLALMGLGYLARRRAWRELLLLLGWEALVIVMLTQHAPLWGHLLLPLAPPVLLAAAIALAEGITAHKRRTTALSVALACLLFIALWPRAREADQATIVAPTEQALLEQEVIPWIQETVPPDQRILTDDPMIAVRAGRLVSYGMSDTSFTKIKSGFLKSKDLIATAERDQVAIIIFWSDRFRGMKNWREWVEEHYVVGYEESPTRIIYIRPDLVRNGD